MTLLFSKRHKIVKLVEDLRIKWNESYNDDNPKWQDDGKKIEKSIYKTTWILYLFIGVSTIVYVTASIIIFFLFFDYESNKNWPLPMQVYYGFEFADYPWTYVLHILMAIPQITIISLTFYGTDIFFINILIFCTSYMKYIQSRCKMLKKKIINGDMTSEEIKREFCLIIEKHNHGINLCKQLENILNILLAVWYSVFTIVICFLFFEFNILLNDLLTMIKVLSFLGIIQALLIMYSYVGTKLIDESQEISFSIYDLPWYAIKDKKLIRYLVLIIMRAQRPCKITTGKFYPLNLETYYLAISTAYSYCTVLNEVMKT